MQMQIPDYLKKNSSQGKRIYKRKETAVPMTFP